MRRPSVPELGKPLGPRKRPAAERVLSKRLPQTLPQGGFAALQPRGCGAGRAHLRVVLQDGEEGVVHPREEAGEGGRLQALQRHGEQRAEGQADVVRVADGGLAPPQQLGQHVQEGPDHRGRRRLLPAGLSALQLQDRKGHGRGR